MNRTQKAALYGLYLVAFMLLIPLGDLVDTKVNPILMRAIGYCLAILMVLPLWFLNKRKAEVDMDERDKAIIKRACIIAAAIVTGGLLAVYAASVLALLPGAQITVSTLQAVVFFALTAFLLVFSSAILIQYGRGGTNGR